VSFSDTCDDYVVPLYGPEFSTQHIEYVGTGGGINAFFPETEHFRAKQFVSYFPTDMCLNSTVPLEANAPHLVVVDPHDPTIGYYPFMLDQDRANAFCTTLIAKKNPGRPEVSLPAEVGDSIEDLRKLPLNIFQAGRRFLRKEGQHADLDAAGVYFGILPLVSDVLKLSNFTQLADQRAIELNNLAKKRGARVKKTLFHGSRKQKLLASDLDDPDVRGYFPEATLDIVTSARCWGVTHWVPGVDYLNFMNSNNVSQRANIVGILNGTHAYKDKIAYLRDAWEVIPWSWAADWCGNFGEYLDVYGNQNLATFESSFIMLEMITNRVFQCSGGSLTLRTTTRERCEAHPSLQLHVPFMSAQRMSILAAIAQKHGTSLRSRRAGGGPGGPHM
jgi:hypothetical protein